MCKSLVQNVVYIWEAINFSGNNRLVKFGIASDHKGELRISIVAKKWGFNHKILFYGVMPDRRTTMEAEIYFIKYLIVFRRL